MKLYVHFNGQDERYSDARKLLRYLDGRRLYRETIEFNAFAEQY